MRYDPHDYQKYAVGFIKDRAVKFSAIGFADAVKDGIVYELKFVSELTHEHFLQCACYMVAMNLPKGILWNTRDNTSFEIEVPDRKAFLNVVTRAVTKGVIENYYEPVGKTKASKKYFEKARWGNIEG